jgi:hypothetical protein
MRRVAILLSLLALDGCAHRAALLGGGGTWDLQGCREDVAPCIPDEGGTGSAASSSLAYGTAAAMLGVGIGALVHQIARWRPPADRRTHR